MKFLLHISDGFRTWRNMAKAIRGLEIVQCAFRQSRLKIKAKAVAASTVQSAFRGFHVRKKIDIALAHAKYIDNDDFEYEEIDLSPYMNLPPECEDMWENTELHGHDNRFLELKDNQHLSPGSIMASNENNMFIPEITVSDSVENNRESNEVDYYDSDSNISSIRKRSKGEVEEAWGECSEAMRELLRKRQQRERKLKMAQKQRKKNADPTFRLRKFRKVSQAVHNAELPSTNQVTEAAWTIGRGGGTRIKRKKGKVPSFVERLRGRTSSSR